MMNFYYLLSVLKNKMMCFILIKIDHSICFICEKNLFVHVQRGVKVNHFNLETFGKSKWHFS